MNFFRENEKIFVKSLIYGFIGGLYYSILFISRTKQITNGNMHTFHEITLFEYIIEILKTSIIVSIGAFIITILYQYYKYEK